MAAKLKALEREDWELRQPNEILRKASAYFCPGGARPPTQAMIAFIDDRRAANGVEPISRSAGCCRLPKGEDAVMPSEMTGRRAAHQPDRDRGLRRTAYGTVDGVDARLATRGAKKNER
jgi:hypothetical protein